jgi:predicted metalloprotease
VQFDDSTVDVSGIDDRRGSGGGGGGGLIAMGGGGLGVVGLILYLVIGVLGGGGGAGTVIGAPGGAGAVDGGTGESSQELSARCNSAGALDRYEDCYLIKVYNEINEVWTDEFARRGATYRAPGLAFFTTAVSTGCGRASSQVGPFYCPADREIYIDLGFLEQLQAEFGAQGRYAQAYIMAHEAGHHLQQLLGTPRDAGSVAIELQADCYAGVWSRLADQRGNVSITESDLDEALNAAAAVGDDRIQQQTQGRVDPETWTHGSAKQRSGWFRTGYRSGDVNACNTFS